MIGFTDSWQYLDMSVPLTFSQLNPGTYTLEIMKYNEESGTKPCWSMSIIVAPPWWKTPLFYFISCLIILLSIALIIYMIIRHYRRKSIQKDTGDGDFEERRTIKRKRKVSSKVSGTT